MGKYTHICVQFMALTAVARAMQDVAATSENAIASSHHRHLPFQQIQTTDKSVIAPALRGRYAASDSTRIPDTDHGNRLLKEEKNEIFEAEEQPADSIFDADKYLQEALSLEEAEKENDKALKKAEKENEKALKEAEKEIEKALKEAEKGEEKGVDDLGSTVGEEIDPEGAETKAIDVDELGITVDVAVEEEMYLNGAANVAELGSTMQESAMEKEMAPEETEKAASAIELEGTVKETVESSDPKEAALKENAAEEALNVFSEPQPGPQPDSYPDSYPGPRLETTPVKTASVKDEVLDVAVPSQAISSMTPGGKFGVSLAFIAVFAVVSVALRRTCTFGRQRMFQKIYNRSKSNDDILLGVNTTFESDIAMNPTTTSPYTAKTSPSQASSYMYDDETNNGIPLCVNTNTIADTEAEMQELDNIVHLYMGAAPTQVAQDTTTTYNGDFKEEYLEIGKVLQHCRLPNSLVETMCFTLQ